MLRPAGPWHPTSLVLHPFTEFFSPDQEGLSLFLVSRKLPLYHLLCLLYYEFIVFQISFSSLGFFSFNTFWSFQMKYLGFSMFFQWNWPHKPISDAKSWKLTPLSLYGGFLPSKALDDSVSIGRKCIKKYQEWEIPHIIILVSKGHFCWVEIFQHQAIWYALTNIKNDFFN